MITNLNDKNYKRERKKRIRREKRRIRKQQFKISNVFRAIGGWIIAIVAAAILGYGYVVFCYQDVYMVGDSMSPTIVDEEKVTMNKLAYYLGSPERFDIVVYKDIDDSESYYYIKRVIGLPGETVQIIDGAVYINGEKLLGMASSDYIFTAGLAEDVITLGDDEYFLMGDNVNNSEDSRFLTVGNISDSVIVGRVKQ